MKALFLRLKRRRKGGFTLVEMIVSVALLAVLMGGMLMFMNPILKSFNDTERNLIADNMANTVQTYITSSIMNADQVAIFCYTNADAINPVSGSKNAAYTARIKELVDHCGTSNGSESNRTHSVKCLHLKYVEDSRGNMQYQLYEESVNMTASGALDPSKSRPVFSQCVYDNMYMTVDFVFPDVNPDPDTTEIRKDVLETTIRIYNAGYQAPIFYGLSYTDLRARKAGLKYINPNDPGGLTNYNKLDAYYKMSIDNGGKDFTTADDNSKDIYIFYTNRRLGAAGAPT